MVFRFNVRINIRVTLTMYIHALDFRFLDLKPEETETPFALPKPKTPGESIVFNFSKVIPMDKTNQIARRRLLTKILTQDSTKEDSTTAKGSKDIIFNLVSEPDEGEINSN